MPIDNRLLQKRLTQVGVIHLGEKRTGNNGKQFPAKLETFRLTSPSKAVREIRSRFSIRQTVWHGALFKPEPSGRVAFCFTQTCLPGQVVCIVR